MGRKGGVMACWRLAFRTCGAILSGRRDGLALAEPELATLLMVADDLRALPDPAFQSKLLAELVPPMEDEMTATDFPSIRPYLLGEQFQAWHGFLRTPADWTPVVRALWVCALYIAVPLGAGYLVFLRRDVAGE